MNVNFNANLAPGASKWGVQMLISAAVPVVAAGIVKGSLAAAGVALGEGALGMGYLLKKGFTIKEAVSLPLSIYKAYQAGTTLNDAIKAGDIGLLKFFVLRGVDVNPEYPSEPPLCVAAKSGNVDAVKILLAAGAKVDSNYRNFTALYLAAEAGHVDVMKILIAAGANVDSVNDDAGGTPLHAAVRSGNINAVKVLIAAHAQVNKSTLMGWSPLHKAAQLGHCAMIGALIEAGAYVNTMDRVERITPLHLAAEKGHVDAMNLLITAKADVNAGKKSELPFYSADSGSKTPLHSAIAEGKIDAMNILLNAGADIEAEALLLAVRCKNVAAALVLLQRGADVNASSQTLTNNYIHVDRTPLHLAAKLGDVDMITTLLANGAEIPAGTELRLSELLGNEWDEVIASRMGVFRVFSNLRLLSTPQQN